MRNILMVLIALFVATSIFGQNKRLGRDLDATDFSDNTFIHADDGVFKMKTFQASIDTFTTTATADTVLISGALATDLYFVTGVGGSVDQQDVLQAEAKADTLIVHRLASGASGLVYRWLRISQ